MKGETGKEGVHGRVMYETFLLSQERVVEYQKKKNHVFLSLPKKGAIQRRCGGKKAERKESNLRRWEKRNGTKREEGEEGKDVSSFLSENNNKKLGALANYTTTPTNLFCQLKEKNKGVSVLCVFWYTLSWDLREEKEG